MKYIFVAFLLIVAVSPFATGQSKNRKSTLTSQTVKYQAIVDENEAVFIFPLKPNQQYEWFPGGLQYAWTVKVNLNNQDFEFGYYMFTAQGAGSGGQGNIQKLLKDGQFSLWKQNSESGSTIIGLTEEGFATYEDNYSDDFLVEKTIISGIATQNKLTVKLSGAKTIQKLFANQPKQITLTSQTTQSEQSVSIPVIYTAKFLAAKNGSPQNRPVKTRNSTCLTNDEAKELINELIPNDPIRYTIEDALTYKPIESLADIKTGYPLAYLLYQKGYVRMEESGYVFSEITDKGKNLNAQYPNGFPLATKTLISVNKVSCVGKKLRVDITYKINPTQVALENLGNDIYRIKPFNQVWKTGIEFISKDGKWNLPENFYLSPVID